MGGDGIRDMDGLHEAAEWYAMQALICVKIKPTQWQSSRDMSRNNGCHIHICSSEVDGHAKMAQKEGRRGNVFLISDFVTAW